MKKFKRFAASILCAALLLTIGAPIWCVPLYADEEMTATVDISQLVPPCLYEINIPEPQVVEEQIPEAVEIEPEFNLTDDEIDLIAIVVMAEAEGECEEGQRLVADTILNRVESPYFPDTVHEVIYQKNQFTSMWNGRADRCYVRDDIRELVVEEAISRYNCEVVFFRTGHYSDYGVPLFQVEHHYFSKY